MSISTQITLKRAILSACTATLAAYTVIGTQFWFETHLGAPALPAQPIQAPALIADAHQLGIDPSHISFRYSRNFQAADLNPSLTIAQFIPPNLIEVKPGLDKHYGPKTEITSVAYEYMHYQWQNEPQAFKNTEGAFYEKYFADNPQFQPYIKDFTGPPDTIHDEMNSVMCVKVPPTALSQVFNDYCNQNIPNRAILFDK